MEDGPGTTRGSVPDDASVASLLGTTPSLHPRGTRRSGWRRFRRNPAAVAGAVYLSVLVVVAIVAPAIAPHNPVQTDVRGAGAYRRAAWEDGPDPDRAGVWRYPLGTDAVGRDVLSRLIYGARVSLLVGVVPTAVILLIGVSLGLVAGVRGGRVDAVLMRGADVAFAFPALLFFVVMQVTLGETAFGERANGLVLLLVTLSVLSWPGIARLVRAEALVLREMEFVVAARAGGLPGWRVALCHVLPNALGPVVVAAAFIAPNAIVTEAILGYLGIGIRPDVRLDAPLPASWGTMVFDGYRAWQSQAWMLIAPSAAIALTTLAFTAVGDGLRDAADPRGDRGAAGA